jgi:hypothetical protein
MENATSGVNARGGVRLDELRASIASLPSDQLMQIGKRVAKLMGELKGERRVIYISAFVYIAEILAERIRVDGQSRGSETSRGGDEAEKEGVPPA